MILATRAVCFQFLISVLIVRPKSVGVPPPGDEGYAIEELVAVLGSAFLSADLELTPDVREDHAAYIALWIKVLKNNKRAIFCAASHAQRAADFLHGLQRAIASHAKAA
jgi:antirestriction protein ArdC